MGNVLDSAPTTYSADDPTKMQQDEWLQSYRHDPLVKTDRIPWGSKGSHLDIGVKVLQEVPGKDLYITNAQGQKVFISKNGQQLPNAAELIRQSPAYGLGPLVEILGPPTNPSYYMWSGNQFTGGDHYKPVKINSMQDLQYAMTHQDNNQYDDNKHSGQFGEASISGPFQKRPRDFWTGVADAEKFVGTVGMQLIVPIAAEVISTVVPGFGMITNALGLQNDLTNAIDNAQIAYQKSIQHKTPSDFQTGMASVITDPRLNSYFSDAHSAYTDMSVQTQNHDPTILRMRSETPEERLLKARAMENAAADMQADQNTEQLESMMDQLKAKYPKKLDWSYFDQMQSGLKLANTPGEKLNVLGTFADKLTNDVQAIQTTQETTDLETEMAGLKSEFPKRLNWAYYDQMQSGLKLANTTEEKQNIINAFATKLDTDVQTLQNASQADVPKTPTKQTAPQQQKTAATPSPQAHKAFWTTPDGSRTYTQPKGSGFGPISWNPLVINGSFGDESQKVVIRG